MREIPEKFAVTGSLSEDGAVRVVVSGGTGVIGRAAVRALVGADHDVVVLTRRPENEPVVAGLGAGARPADLFDVDTLAAAYDGADAVVNLASHVPVGYAASWPGAWRRNDELRTAGVAAVVEAAKRAGVRRLVHASSSCLYADAGDDWVTESSRLEITGATEPLAVGEAHVQDYSCSSRAGVILRLGVIVGDDPATRYFLKAAAHGRPVGFGRPGGWIHLVHTDDLGPAVLAALHAPAGAYNVGAAPVRRAELVDGYAAFVGAGSGSFAGPVLRRLAGPRMEPLSRSLRVCSEQFSAQTGWVPLRPDFGPAWFDAAAELQAPGLAR
jgi:nucleoside-diphosphate-sugar epimerase